MKIIVKKDYISRKSMIVKIHLETTGAILEKGTRSDTFKKGTKWSKGAFSKLSWRLNLE